MVCTVLLVLNVSFHRLQYVHRLRRLVLTLACALYVFALVDQSTMSSAYRTVCVSGRYLTMSLMYCVKRVQLSLRHSFVDVTPSIWVAIVLSVRKFFIHRYILLRIPASLIFMKRKFVQTLS